MQLTLCGLVLPAVRELPVAALGVEAAQVRRRLVHVLEAQ